MSNPLDFLAAATAIAKRHNLPMTHFQTLIALGRLGRPARQYVISETARISRQAVEKALPSLQNEVRKTLVGKFFEYQLTSEGEAILIKILSEPSLASLRVGETKKPKTTRKMHCARALNQLELSLNIKQD